MSRLPYLQPRRLSDVGKSDRDILIEIRNELSELAARKTAEYEAQNKQTVTVLPKSRKVALRENHSANNR